jgi:hypothetical protein
MMGLLFNKFSLILYQNLKLLSTEKRKEDGFFHRIMAYNLCFLKNERYIPTKRAIKIMVEKKAFL